MSKRKSIADRLRDEEAMLEAWLSKLSLAVTKIRYYRRRIKQLQRQRDKPPRGSVTRGIRLSHL